MRKQQLYESLSEPGVLHFLKPHCVSCVASALFRKAETEKPADTCGDAQVISVWTRSFADGSCPEILRLRGNQYAHNTNIYVDIYIYVIHLYDLNDYITYMLHDSEYV